MRHQGWAGKRHIKIYIYFYKFLFSAHPLMTKEWVIQSIFDKQKNMIEILWRQSSVFSPTHEWKVKQTIEEKLHIYARSSIILYFFSFSVSWIACLNASSSNHRRNLRHLVFSSVHFSSECKYLLYPFWKKFRQRRIWQAKSTTISYAKLFGDDIIQFVMLAGYSHTSDNKSGRTRRVWWLTADLVLTTELKT